MTEKQTAEKETRLYSRQRRFAILGGGLVCFVAAVVLVTLVASHINQSRKQPLVATVRITQNGFVPATLSVKPGTKVVWTNDDQTLHQIVANPFPKGTDLPSLKSQILNNAQNYTYVASTTGSFGYHDQLHPTVNGTLVVEKQ